MRRFISTQLYQWKQSVARKPLILQGARQVGKTYALKAFGQAAFKDFVYCNFERDAELHRAFDGSLSPAQILKLLGAYFGKTIHAQETLIIFDEIQECGPALTSLKYFYEDAPQYMVAAAGSLLGVALAEQSSFPVGSVDFLSLEPLTFFEFICANKKEAMIQYLHDQGFLKKPLADPIPTPLAEEFMRQFSQYQIVGGMPEAVQRFISSQSYDEVRTVHDGILKSYVHDFAKHAPRDEVAQILAVWDVIPSMLGRENKKFTFSIIRPNARASEYERAINWLVHAGVVRQVKRVSSPSRPLRGNEDTSAFKLYSNDVGLLCSQMNIPSSLILSPDKLLGQFSGAVAECFVAQELSALGFRDLHYWTSPGSAEIDFILDLDQNIAPLEVKAGHNLKSRSLTSYVDKYAPPLALRASLQNINRSATILNCPLYALPLLQVFAPTLNGAGTHWWEETASSATSL
jgi:uncharacterized protein